MTPLEMIAAERQRQIEVEGQSLQRDDKCEFGELSEAAACYSSAASALIRGAEPDEIRFIYEPYMSLESNTTWPFHDEHGEAVGLNIDADPLRTLAKAGAFVVAEMERIIRVREEGLSIDTLTRDIGKILGLDGNG